jgi:hypothetical protein
MWALRAVFTAAAASVLGCAASAPPPQVYAVRPGGAPVTGRWEQFCEQAMSVSQASWLASSRGSDGWELAGMSNGVLCYKRPEPLRVQPAAMAQAAPYPGALPAPPGAPLPTQQTMAQHPPAPPPGAMTSASRGTVPVITDPGF